MEKNFTPYLYPLVIILSLAMWTDPSHSERSKFRPNLDAGQQIYRQNCINCHGSAGKGDGVAAPQLDPKPADLTSAKTQDKKDPELLEVIKFGRPGTSMSAWTTTLDDDEIQNVLAYVRSLKP
jgi:mono/diheme cytochrome c family protein